MSSKNQQQKQSSEKISDIDKKVFDKFNKELSDLIKKHSVKQYAGVFIVNGRQLLAYYPDDITATNLLKQAHSVCRENVIQRIGG